MLFRRGFETYSVAGVTSILKAFLRPGLLRNAVSAVAETATIGISTFLLYYYAVAHLGVKAIGAWSLAAATASVSRIADVGVGNALMRFVPAALARDRKDEAIAQIETAFATIGALYLVVLLLGEPLMVFTLKATVEAAELPLLLAILPFVLLSFWLSNVGLVFLCALAGVHRYDQRSIASMVGAVVWLVAAVALIPHFGIMGLVGSQVIQSGVVLLLAWILLRQHLAVGLLPLRFSYAQLRTMLAFGAKLQIASISGLLFEPTTRVILSSWGGLTDVGYYEMASRMVMQVRSLLVSAVQASTPALADLHERDQSTAFQAYSKTLQTTWLLTFPMMAAFAAFIPAIGEFWLGYRSDQFVAFALIMAFAWTINLLAAPGFFMGWASGHLYGNLWGSAVVAAANLPLGILFGALWGGVGVVVATALALTAGSIFILVFNDRLFGRMLGTVFSPSLLAAGALSLLGTVVAICVYSPIRDRFGMAGGIAVALATMAVATGLSIQSNPEALMPLKALRAKLASPAR